MLKLKMDVRFEVFTAVTMKNAVFWDVAPCRSCVNRHFGGMSAASCSSWFLARGFFYPEDRGDTFLRKVKYTCITDVSVNNNAT
jgi:hypothetical protein